MKKVVGIFVGIFLCMGIATAQDRTIFDTYPESKLKQVFLEVVNSNAGQQPTEEQRQLIISILTEFQSISQHLVNLYENTIPSQRTMDLLWDDKIALQKDEFNQHLYYRALFAYYLIIYSTAPGKGEGLDRKISWEQIDFKNRFGVSIYRHIEGPNALDQIADENPESKSKIINMKNMYAYASGAEIPEEKLQKAWESGIKQKLTGEDNVIIQFLYSSEFKRLWDMLFKAYMRSPSSKFDLHWDKTFWLQKDAFAEHRYYRQMVCTFITDFGNSFANKGDTPEMNFGNDFSQFMGCPTLNVQNYYEFKWYKKIIDQKQKRLNKKNSKSKEKGPDSPEIQDNYYPLG